MSDLSPRLALPYLAPGQAQKHVTHNAALDRLDLLVQLTLQGFAAETPPATPAEGEAWGLGAAPTGAWAGQGGRIAAWQGGGWVFVTPAEGWLAYGVQNGQIRVWEGDSWVIPPDPDSLQNLTRLGLGTTADATNRLAVASPGSLFTHAGGGDHRMAVNKSTPADTASLLFQTGFSGRAEMGLAGDDGFAVKVSADGSTWATALDSDPASGRVSFPQGVDAGAFTLRDGTDPTRAGAFSAAQIAPNTTRSYTMPNASGTLALLQGAQEFSGPLMLSGGATVAGSFGADRLGLGGALADATNRLAVNAPATLLNHAGAGHEATVNKAAAAQDAALAFKTGFSARALLGLLGTDDLSLKVSPDGSAFAEALAVNRTTARVALPAGLALGGHATDPASPQDGWLWHNSATGALRARAGGASRSLTGQDRPFLVPVAGDFVGTSLGTGSSLTSAAGATNLIDLYPFTPGADLTVDGVALNVTAAVAGTNAKIVIYGADANGRPATLLVETGDLSCATTGVKTAAITASSFWQGVTYWLGVRHSGAPTISAYWTYTTPGIHGGSPVVTGRSVLRRFVSYATAAPNPWGFTAAEINNAAAPTVWLRVA